MDTATILALALKYGPTAISLIAKYGPALLAIVTKHSDQVVAAAKVVDDANHSDPLAALSAFLGQLSIRIPEVKQLEPAILQHIQDNGDAAIKLQEQMEQEG